MNLKNIVARLLIGQFVSGLFIVLMDMPRSVVRVIYICLPTVVLFSPIPSWWVRWIHKQAKDRETVAEGHLFQAKAAAEQEAFQKERVIEAEHQLGPDHHETLSRLERADRRAKWSPQVLFKEMGLYLARLRTAFAKILGDGWGEDT